jgi:biotin transport system substrate-specific component
MASVPTRSDTETRDAVLIAAFAAITIVLGAIPPLSVPVIPVPITAQTLGVMLAGAILGARRAFLALGLFVLLVALGLPVLAGGRGGISVFAAPSGGFILAWPVGAAIVGAILSRSARPSPLLLAAANLIGGIVAIYAIGIPWLAATAHLPLARAALGSLVFVPGDLVKALIAVAICRWLDRAYAPMRLRRGRARWR